MAMLHPLHGTTTTTNGHHHRRSISAAAAPDDSSSGSPVKAFFASQEFSADDYPSPIDSAPPRPPVTRPYANSAAWPYPWDPPPLLPHDDERLRVLESYEILDTTPEHVFDMLCAMAIKALKVPIGGISFVDKSRQWCKSSIGLKQTVIPRNVAFCAHTIASTSPLVVLDATLDKRFYQNPLVTGPANLTFYAGAPIVNPGGFVLGTVFVYGHHAEDAVDVAILVKIAKMAMNHLEDRRRANVSEARHHMHAGRRHTSVVPPEREREPPSHLMHPPPPPSTDTMLGDGYRMPPPTQATTHARRDALHTLDLLDMPPELVFDRLAGLASTLLQCPIAGVSLLDDDKQWFKAHRGSDQVNLADVATFCVHVIASTRPLVVLNAADDARFKKHPLVKRRHVRFFAAAPIVTNDGHVIGTVFVMDTLVRQAGHVDLHSLQRLAKVATLHLSQRIQYTVTPVLDYSSFLDENAQVFEPMDDGARHKKGGGGFQRLRTRFLSRLFGQHA
ncbi:Aste57867_12160 [Aphanomyces stellatus]|uniref:Aste57867_12160 protein n=1 Tax=Aphanomyces stellatus TaxID=120398 RepID=A0A485KUV5_9STRA|nr:hypothetical protein As57867_012115 [Aphanomyces stellatus]VFT89014.1 Aste57867_12160 [Aphanomyces stellatus]